MTDIRKLHEAATGCSEPTDCEARAKAECEWCLSPKPSIPAEFVALLEADDPEPPRISGFNEGETAVYRAWRKRQALREACREAYRNE